MKLKSRIKNYFYYLLGKAEDNCSGKLIKTLIKQFLNKEFIKNQKSGCITKFNYNNHKYIFYLPQYPYDVIQRIIRIDKNFYEFGELKKYKRYIDSESIVADVGANIGNHTIFISGVLKAKKVYSFEPVVDTYNVLRKNVELNNLSNAVIVENVAVGKKTTRVNVHYDGKNMGWATVEYNDSGNQDVISLDKFFAEKEKPTLIKIDVEGFEMEVLEGANNIISKYKPIVIIESFSHHRDKRLNNAEKVKQYFKSKEYIITELLSKNNYIFTPAKH